MKNPFKVNDIVRSVFNNNVSYIVSEVSDDHVIICVYEDPDLIFTITSKDFKYLYLYSGIEVNSNELVLNIYFSNLKDSVREEIVKVWNEQNNTEWTVKDFESDCLNYQPIAKSTFEIDPRQ